MKTDRNKRNHPADDDDDDLSSDDEDYKEEEEEEDEDIDEEDEPSHHQSSKKRPKKKKRAFDGFIDDEAEVDEDDEEEDQYDEDDDLIHDEIDEVDDRAPDQRKFESTLRMRELLEQDEEEIERYYAKKYQNESYGDRFGSGEVMADSIVQQSQLPQIKDPNLWVIKCRMGEEKSTVLALMRKFIAMQTTDNPLQIKSCFAKEGLKGYIYIEAFRQNHVKEAIDGINALGMARYKQNLVPINEMTDVLKVVKECRALKPGQWVRIKSGIFKDDLAMVDFVEDAQNLVSLKLLPRIDYEKYSRLMVGKDESGKQKKWKRPPAAPLDVKKIKDRITNEGSSIIFAGNRYDSDGFLRKLFRINTISSEGITPTLSELEQFGQTLDNSQLAVAASMVNNNTAGASSSSDVLISHQFVPGDVVIVSQGDLKGLKGKIISVERDSNIIVQPNHTELKEPIPFTPPELQKFFSQGDHVKILSGPHEGETGLVIRFDPTVAIVLSDQNMSELKVMPKNLRLWQDHAINVNTSSHVQMLDLVQVDAQTVGVVVASEREKISILTTLGKVIEVKSNTSFRRLNAGTGPRQRTAQALDKNSNLIQAKDSVTFTEKPYSGMTGEVKHIYRSWAFVYCRTHMKNAGMIVARSKQVTLVGAPSSAANIKQLPNANKKSDAPQSRSNFQEKKLYGKTARIIAGTLKGLTGIIFEATAREVYLELHSQFRKVHVLRENIALVDCNGRILPNQLGGTISTPRATSIREAPQTPLHGSQTPHVTSMTPRPDATPLSNYFMASMATPAVRSGEEPQTPNSNFVWQTPNDYKMGLSLSDNE